MATYASLRGGNNYNVTVTSGGASTKGAYVEVTASTAFDSSKLWLGTAGNTQGNVYMTDIATGAAASEVVQVANLICQGLFNEIYGAYYIGPIDLDIASGTRIALATQSNTAGADTFGGWIMQENRALGSLTDPVTYGADSGTTLATVVDPGAVADTKGGYVQITASTTSDHDAVLVLVGMGTNTAVGTGINWNLDIATGAGGAEVIKVPDITLVSSTTSDALFPPVSRFEFTIASGTRIAVNAMCTSTDATDRLIQVSIIGLDQPAAAGGGGASAYAYA